MVGFENVTFEMSLKPFCDAGDETMVRVCERIFSQWSALIHETEGVSVMLWTADGSEILDYRGDLTGEFEWSKWIGVANPRRSCPPESPMAKHMHNCPQLYMENPPCFTYGWLKRLVATLKRIGGEMTGKPVRVGATFDPGPEFAVSKFKYERHLEACMGDTMGSASMICCYASLKADDYPYAGYPEGLPENTPFGEFLGRQSQCFLGDLGFDYLWLSNGFGFGLETWGLKGALFNGREFALERREEVREKSMQFWRAFRRECDIPLQTRGTNLSTGMDLSSDAVPLREIYRTVPDLAPPPNSPWAALNSDFGLELVGWMSHIAELPGDSFPFRFYTHDPWFLNSPWLDRYQRQPHDIYLPMSVARLDSEGRAQVPNSVEFLTIDDSYGRMPEQVPNEVTPYLLDTRAHAPDAPGLLTWVYPFDEYHDMTFGDPARVEEVFFGDWFMRGALNNGLPLNTVVSTGNALNALSGNRSVFAETILVTPVPDADSPWAATLAAFVERGGRALLYGPIRHADPHLLEMLNVARAEELEGDFTLTVNGSHDIVAGDPMSRTLRHHALFSGGGLDGILADVADSATKIFAEAARGAYRRLAALSRALPQWNGGRVAWVRGTVSCDPEKIGGHLLVPFSPAEAYPAESLMRLALRTFDVDLRVEKLRVGQPTPMTCIARHENGFFFSGFSADTTVAQSFRLPQGAPLITGLDTVLVGGCARYAMPRAWFRECRVFVDQADGGPLSCRVRRSGHVGIGQRLEVKGLVDATVRFFPQPETTERVEMRLNAAMPCLTGDIPKMRRIQDALGGYIEVSGINGLLMISW